LFAFLAHCVEMLGKKAGPLSKLALAMVKSVHFFVRLDAELFTNHARSELVMRTRVPLVTYRSSNHPASHTERKNDSNDDECGL